MIITKTCSTCEHFPNDKHCIGCEWDKDKGENSKWELKKNPVVIERKVLEQIKDEIEHWESDDTQDDYQMGAMDMQNYVLRVIDKYRKEQTE